MRLTLALILYSGIAYAADSYMFSSHLTQIATLSLGRHKNAVLVNAHVCNTDPTKSILLPQEQVLFTATDLDILSAAQAHWFLTQKGERDWAAQGERLGTLGLAMGASMTGLPYVAMVIPLLQQLVDFWKGRKPDVTPFLNEMLPAKIPLGPAGSGGECATGSLFAAKKGSRL